MHRIALYNNASGMAEQLSFLCRGEQISVVVEKTQEQLLKDVAEQTVSLVLMDIFIEDGGWGEGLLQIASVRRHCRLPIIVIASQRKETAKIAALSMGADDCVCADDNPLVILAHVKAQLRRYLQLTSFCKNLDKIYCVDGLMIDDARRKVTVDGREVKLTPIEYQILRLLVMEKGRVLSNHQIYEDIWKMQAVDVDNTVAVHVRHIREKIEQNPRKPRYLKVIWGTGYMVG